MQLRQLGDSMYERNCNTNQQRRLSDRSVSVDVQNGERNDQGKYAGSQGPENGDKQ